MAKGTWIREFPVPLAIIPVPYLMYDLIIIGGGPGGVAAGIYAVAPV
jgi:hypothetical protein